MAQRRLGVKSTTWEAIMETRVMRPGKTRRDHLTGSWTNHLENQDARRRWNQEYATVSKGGGMKVIPYPRIAH